MYFLNNIEVIQEYSARHCDLQNGRQCEKNHYRVVFNSKVPLKNTGHTNFCKINIIQTNKQLKGLVLNSLVTRH